MQKSAIAKKPNPATAKKPTPAKKPVMAKKTGAAPKPTTPLATRATNCSSMSYKTTEEKDGMLTFMNDAPDNEVWTVTVEAGHRALKPPVDKASDSPSTAPGPPAQSIPHSSFPPTPLILFMLSLSLKQPRDDYDQGYDDQDYAPPREPSVQKPPLEVIPPVESLRSDELGMLTTISHGYGPSPCFNLPGSSSSLELDFSLSIFANACFRLGASHLLAATPRSFHSPIAPFADTRFGFPSRLKLSICLERISDEAASTAAPIIFHLFRSVLEVTCFHSVTEGSGSPVRARERAFPRFDGGDRAKQIVEGRCNGQAVAGEERYGKIALMSVVRWIVLREATDEGAFFFNGSDFMWDQAKIRWGSLCGLGRVRKKGPGTFASLFRAAATNSKSSTDMDGFSQVGALDCFALHKLWFFTGFSCALQQLIFPTPVHGT
ncbi:hypothetical protein BDK51DRAFT_37251 [Blyttiomyces helicus]|uniref:Uncharacterized protein n=1 Tax=Blyttiomyces helicus TaxID=388810 RepID=A0A4P9WGZ7_9FUNG|nr:hypothetical protein BDK51DRAFT_37251 [Blyttiomyces helicus]|eukprot:RKO92091.1 hypothetical protein BDK51DRAFT_37251 [Blyttiomyces helicus]